MVFLAGVVMKNGFSLLELIIVLGIVGIITAIAYPSYETYITRSRRADGQSALLDLAARMERYYSSHNTYATATIASGNAQTDILRTSDSPNGWYTLTITNQENDNYAIQATPRLEKTHHDEVCQSLTYNSLGQKGITNGPLDAPTGTTDDCW